MVKNDILKNVSIYIKFQSLLKLLEVTVGSRFNLENHIISIWELASFQFNVLFTSLFAWMKKKLYS